MSDANKQILLDANAAIVRGDHEGFLRHCTDDTEWIFVGEQTLKGKDEVRRWMADSYREPPQFELHRLVAEDDYVIAIGEITLEDDAGTPAKHEYCDVWRLRDGRLAQLRAFVLKANGSDAARDPATTSPRQ
jgi:uncharacterized protein